MNRTSPGCRSVRSAARSPVRTSAGPEVIRSPTPISAATIPDKRGLAQTRWPHEQKVVDCLAALACSFDHDLEVLGQLRPGLRTRRAA